MRKLKDVFGIVFRLMRSKQYIVIAFPEEDQSLIDYNIKANVQQIQDVACFLGDKALTHYQEEVNLIVTKQILNN